MLQHDHWKKKISCSPHNQLSEMGDCGYSLLSLQGGMVQKVPTAFSYLGVKASFRSTGQI
jgi:hypothetical protein